MFRRAKPKYFHKASSIEEAVFKIGSCNNYIVVLKLSYALVSFQKCYDILVSITNFQRTFSIIEFAANTKSGNTLKLRNTGQVENQSSIVNMSTTNSKAPLFPDEDRKGIDDKIFSDEKYVEKF